MRHAFLLFAATLSASVATSAPAQDVPADELLTCGFLCNEDGTPLTTAVDEPPDTDLVTRIFLGGFSELCSWAIGGGPGMYEPEVYDLAYHPTWADEGEPDRPLKLYRFFCGAGAYNERHVYYTWTADAGVRPVSFALPTYTVELAPSNDIDGALERLTVTGMRARHELVNSSFDEEAGTISEWSCWRGLCDASGRGTWVFDTRDGEFRLVTYDVDPTYDGEVNLFRLADFSTAAEVDISTPLPFEPPVFEDEEEEAD